MFNFCLDFIQNKFFDIPQSFESKIDELVHQLPDSNAKKELNDITKETMRRIEASKGFNKLVKLSDNNIKRFHTLIQISIVQFYNKLPTDNPVYDRVLKNALNVVEPGIASGYNKQVAKAVESAKKEFNVKFSYEPYNASDNVYPLYSIDLIPKEYETNTERRIEKILEYRLGQLLKKKKQLVIEEEELDEVEDEEEIFARRKNQYNMLTKFRKIK